MKIYAPVKDTNGIYASVRFVNGVGETDNPRLIKWFKDHGYKLSRDDSNSVIEETILVIPHPNDEIETENDRLDESDFVEINKVADEPNFESMTPLEIRDWAKENGYGSVIKNTRNKEKLIELLRG